MQLDSLVPHRDVLETSGHHRTVLDLVRPRVRRVSWTNGGQTVPWVSCGSEEQTEKQRRKWHDHQCGSQAESIHSCACQKESRVCLRQHTSFGYLFPTRNVLRNMVFSRKWRY